MSLYGGLSDTLQGIRTTNQYVREAAMRRSSRDPSPASAGASLIVQTATDGSYPTTPSAVFVCTPLQLDADDTEGASVTSTGDTNQNVYCVNVGSAVPPEGTMILAHAVGGRWVIRYDG